MSKQGGPHHAKHQAWHLRTALHWLITLMGSACVVLVECDCRSWVQGCCRLSKARSSAYLVGNFYSKPRLLGWVTGGTSGQLDQSNSGGAQTFQTGPRFQVQLSRASKGSQFRGICLSTIALKSLLQLASSSYCKGEARILGLDRRSNLQAQPIILDPLLHPQRSHLLLSLDKYPSPRRPFRTHHYHLLALAALALLLAMHLGLFSYAPASLQFPERQSSTSVAVPSSNRALRFPPSILPSSTSFQEWAAGARKD